MAAAAPSGTKRPADAAADGAAKKPAVGTYTRADFLEVFPTLTSQLVDEIFPQYEMDAEPLAWIRRMVEYTVPGGKLTRGLTVVHTLQALRGDKPCTPDELNKAAVLGWCVEWLQAFFLVADDLMDKSTVRRGAPCWYLVEGVGTTAVNDSFILEACIYSLLKRHFRSSPAYGQLLELFRETTLQTELGQLLDLTSNPLEGPTDLDRFTEKRHGLIVKYKTAFYSFYLPVALGLVLGGVASEAALATAQSILVEMGTYFQVQDDYLDCYGSEEVIGKVGTDIQDNKCSWLVVQALKKATPEQAAVLKANYGKHDDAAVARVKALFVELELEALFHAYEASSYASLQAKISAATASGEVPAVVFEGLLAKIYKRSK